MSAKLSDQVLERIKSLPALPGAVEQLCHLTSSVEADFDKITQIISIDEALTTRLLQVVNSPFYGLSQKINTVSEAIVTLGFQSVRSLALGVSVVGFNAGMAARLFGKNDPLTREDLWRHSLGVAGVARAMGAMFNIPQLEEVFVGGLLHDIGKIIFLDCFHKEYLRVIEESVKGTRPLGALELETFGMDHTTLAEELCRRWKIPPELARMVSRREFAVSDQGIASSDDLKLHAIQFANLIVRVAGVGFDGDPTVNLELLRILEAQDIPPGQMDETISSLPEEVRRAEQLFGLANKRPPRQTLLAEPSLVGILMGDSRERAIARMLVLSLGYVPLALDAPPAEDCPAIAFLIDHTTAPAIQAAAPPANRPVLDVSQWQSQNAVPGHPALLHIRNFQLWLRQGLESRPAE